MWDRPGWPKGPGNESAVRLVTRKISPPNPSSGVNQLRMYRSLSVSLARKNRTVSGSPKAKEVGASRLALNPLLDGWSSVLDSSSPVLDAGLGGVCAGVTPGGVSARQETTISRITTAISVKTDGFIILQLLLLC